MKRSNLEQSLNLPVKQERQVELRKLTSAQERLIEVLREPKYKELGIEDLCKQAAITRPTYYNAFRDSNFIAHLESEMAAFRSASDFAVMHNLVEQARTSKNERLIALYQRLQGRLREGGERPAQIVLVFGGGVERPKEMRVVEGEVIKDES